MRIRTLDAYHVCIPLRGKVQHASHARTDTHSIVIRCRLDDGTEGWGEGLPRSYVTGETIETAWEQFRSADWPRMLGERFSDLCETIALCDRIRLDTVSPPGQRDCFGNSLRCAVELAVLDATARACGRPFSEITTLVTETDGLRQNEKRVRYSAVLTALSPVKAMLRGLAFRLFGFNQCKMKVGVAGTDDRTAVLRVRRAVGGSCDLRVDANEAWTCRELESHVSPLVPLGITSLEQPVPHGEVEGLAAIRSRLGVPVMLDESLCSQSDAERAIEHGTCDLFNIRLSKCGGFIPSLRIAAIAKQAGLGYQLGCQVGETGILSAAGRHFATSVAGIRHLEGSFDRLLVAERLTTEDLTFGWGGWAPALRGPGLGITIDRAGLERVTVARENRRVAA
jgi:L-alanine-DL-glutamate epimerase-like enolase superfamily enzyme